jgi:hypothetical protein
MCFQERKRMILSSVVIKRGRFNRVREKRNPQREAIKMWTTEKKERYKVLFLSPFFFGLELKPRYDAGGWAISCRPERRRLRRLRGGQTTQFMYRSGKKIKIGEKSRGAMAMGIFRRRSREKKTRERAHKSNATPFTFTLNPLRSSAKKNKGENEKVSREQ